MNRNPKSKDYKLTEEEIALREEFYRCYENLKRYDSIIVQKEFCNCEDLSIKYTEEDIDDLQQLQRNIIIHMMAINARLGIKDKVADTFLQHLVYTLGL